MSQIVSKLSEVSGHVQGVCYRAYVRNKALELGLTGYALNLSSGNVEVFVKGPEGETQELIEWLWTGSPHCEVKSVEGRDLASAKIKEENPSGFKVL